MTDKKKGRGRPPLIEGEESLDLVFKAPKSLNTDLEEALKQLKSQGYEASKSELIRSLVGFRIGNAAAVYKEVLRNI